MNDGRWCFSYSIRQLFLSTLLVNVSYLFILTGKEEEVSIDELLSDSGFQEENNYVQVSNLVQISSAVNIKAHR